MSFSGTLTPLALNALSSLQADTGLAINGDAKTIQGVWLPTGYTAGILVNNTVLANITAKIKTAYSARLATTILPSSYRSMLTLGSGVCPALGNSRPTTFKPTYPGFGSWTGATQNNANYPPKNYPVSSTYSYIQQAFGDYAWITGWPGANAWQKSTDTYKAATVNTPEYDEYFSDGFIATIARQAYNEMWGGQFDDINHITTTFQTTYNFKNQQNPRIASIVNSKTFMTGSYSNVNDLGTSDIAGVNQALKVWGNDLIASGRTLSLHSIARFGLPSVLLKTLYKNSAITDAVKMSMLLQSMTPTQVDNVLNPEYTATAEEERKLYDSFTAITGNDLSTVLYNLNCKTTGLESLADLLSPRKLFPNSYQSLTVARYSLDTASAKIYDFIYNDGGVNDRLKDYGDYLSGILSEDLKLSCGAFSVAMQQIKNISGMDIQKFSQVVANIELIDKDLTLVGATAGPVDTTLVDNMLAKVAMGSGNNNAFRQCDFFGAASGYPYKQHYTIIEQLLKSLPTGNLANIYASMPITTDAEIADFVTAANAEIAALYAVHKNTCDKLNYHWDMLGQQLAIEQRAIPLAIPISLNILENIDPTNIDQFVSSIEQYSLDNSDGQSAKTLEAISDTSVFGGQALVAAMREARNAKRMQLTGGDLQNSIDANIDTCAASASAIVVDGKITGVNITNRSSGYTATNMPAITVYPVGLGAKLVAILAEDGSIRDINVVDTGKGYTKPQIEISPPPGCQHQNPPQQTYADTSESRLVPPELIAPASASRSVNQAILDVHRCNCDCWN
jgi:hypothetical protein